MRRGRRARGVTERHPLVKECAGRTTQPSFLHFTVVQCTYCYYLPSLPSIPLILCRVPYSLQDNCFQKRDNGEEGLGMLPPYALPLSACESDTEPGNQWVGLELLADNRQINRHCLFSKKKLLYWKIFWMFLEVGGKWRRLEVTRRGRGSDGFCSLRGISYSPRATDWHTCTTCSPP